MYSFSFKFGGIKFSRWWKMSWGEIQELLVETANKELDIYIANKC